MQQLRPASVRQASSIPRILKRHAPPRETARVAGSTNLYRHVRDPKPDPGIAPNLDDRGGRGNTALSPGTPYEGREKRAGMGGAPEPVLHLPRPRPRTRDGADRELPSAGSLQHIANDRAALPRRLDASATLGV